MSTALATEETLIIETPERVPLHFALASIGNRFLACAVDHAIQAVTIGVMVIAFTIVANYSTFGDYLTNAPKWVYAVLIIVVFLLISGYFAFFEWLWSGQTPGKRWLKLRVIREDGRPITFFEAVVRNLREQRYTGALALELSPENAEPASALRQGKKVLERLCL